MTLSPREKCMMLVESWIVGEGWLPMMSERNKVAVASSVASFTGNEVGEATEALRAEVDELRRALKYEGYSEGDIPLEARGDDRMEWAFNQGVRYAYERIREQARAALDRVGGGGGEEETG